MDRIECLKMQLLTAIESAMQDLESTDTRELGEAIDMLKDLAEASYYCTVTKAMKEKEEVIEPHLDDMNEKKYNIDSSN